MQTIGLIGGMSWESTVTYYQVINEVVKSELGGLHSAKIVLYSVDFEEIARYQAVGNWERSGEVLGAAARALELVGANFILICTNTMHKIVPQIERYVSIPILHIAKMTAMQLHLDKVSRVGLLGTRYTMQEDFYKQILIDEKIEVILPEDEDMDLINSVIYDELCLGHVREASKAEFIRIIEDLRFRGAEGIILGCTEIGLLIAQHDTDILLYDTAIIHAKSAALKSVEEDVSK